jgi:two-component system response regulator AlgR
MLVVVGGDHIKLPIDDVLYFRAEAKCVLAFTSRRSFRFESSLDTLEREFPGKLWRVHRKYLVKGNAVTGLVKIDGSLFLDIHGATEPVPVSRREAPKVRELFAAEVHL